MRDPIGPGGRRNRRFLLGFLTIALIGFCCWSIIVPRTPSGVLDAANGFDEEALINSAPIDRDNVEAYAIERRGGVIDIGFVITSISADRTSEAITSFEAELHNLGVNPVKEAFVTLRLIDEDGLTVDMVDLKGDEEILPPGTGQTVRGHYTIGDAVSRIVEETIAAGPDEFLSFTLSSYNDEKLSPGFMEQVAGFLPFVEYRTVWTQPGADWDSYQIQFRYERVLR